MQIDRSAVLNELEAFARAGSGVVIGQPGVGKSYLLRQLNERLEADATPHLFIPVDQLGGGTDNEVAEWIRPEPSRFFAELRDKAAVKRGVVVFDSFDAARSDEARNRILNLIRTAKRILEDQWSVIVTVRTYDASRSRALLDLFDASFSGIRKYEVKELGDNEVAQAVAQVNGLSDVLAKAGPELRALLRIPFNLWLTEQMLEHVESAAELGAVRSEVQLLETYWQRRITRSNQAAAREAVLRAVVDEMVRRRALSLPRHLVYTNALPDAWTSLMSAAVLREDDSLGGTPRVSFSHNILFDYAVSVLAVGDSPQDFSTFIAEDPTRPLFLQPSLNYYLSRVWYFRPQSFWQHSRVIQQSDSLPVRVFARLVPPLVVARESRSLSDLRPLLNALQSDREFGNEFTLRLFQALRLEPKVRTDLWASFAADVSQRIDRSFAWDLVTYAASLVDVGSSATEELIGEVARMTCGWLLQERGISDNTWLTALGANWIVPLVISTAATNKDESTQLLRRVLAIADEPNFPIQYLYSLSDKIEQLVEVDTELAGDVYRRVYAQDEESTEETQFGTPVLPLRSNRRQDYGMCRYVLGKAYPTFLQKSFVVAATAGVQAINAYVLRNRLENDRSRVQTFRYRHKRARYRPDYSYIWGGGRFREDALELADDLFEYVRKQAATNDTNTVQMFLDILAARADVALLWRMLLQQVARQPRELVPPVKDLLLSRPILTNAETIHEVGAVLAVAEDALTSADWRQIEERIDGLVGKAVGRKAKRLSLMRQRLLVSFPPDRLVDPELRQTRQKLESEGVVNDELSRITVSSGTFTHRDWLQEKGVAIDAPENQVLIQLRDELETQTAQWTNKPIPTGVARNFLASAKHASVIAEASSAASPLVRTSFWTAVAKALTLASLSASSLDDSEQRDLRHMLLSAVGEDPMVPTTPEDDTPFESPAWSPTPLTESANGVVFLAAVSNFSDLLDKLRAMASSRSHAVRFLVASELFRLYKLHPSFFWEIIETRLKDEKKYSIRDTLWQTLFRLPANESQRMASLAVAHFDMEVRYSRSSKESSAYGLLLTWLALRRKEVRATELLDRIISDAAANPRMLHSVVRAAVETIEPEVLADPGRAFIARAAGAFVPRALAAVREAFASIAALENDTRAEDLKELYSILDDTTHLLHHNLTQPDDRQRPPLTTTVDFYAAARPILEEVVRFGYREAGGVIYAPTAHRLMEFFNVLLPADPRGVLHLAAEVAVISERTGYSLDAMAIRQVVDMAEELLADYRHELQTPTATADLVRLLDVFARVGWPEALRLVLRLDEVFR